MKYIFHFIIIVNAAILSAALPLHSTAQTGDSGNPEENYRAVNWTIHDGLSNGMTNFILKDLYGFVWFGTNNGLNRFDGNLFKKYTNIPHDTRSISGDMITGIVEDSLHNIWIGSNMGLTRYDIRADTFTNMPRIASSAVDYAAFPFWATKTEVYAVDSGFNIVAYNILSYVKRRVAALNNSDSIGYNLSPG